MSVRYAKSSWICCVTISALLVASPLAAKKSRDRSPEELTNFLLGPEYSQWLVGAVARIASEEEIRAYLQLTDAAAAAAFVDEFWQRRRSADAVWPADQPRAQFETRAREADRRFSEGARLGRRSDRGTIFILYGEPQEVRYELSARRGPREPKPIEVWEYPKDAPKGLDGERPERFYYFIQMGDETVFTQPPRIQRRLPGGA